MPRFDVLSVIDHRLDNRIIDKKDLRFTEQETAEDFATAQYKADFIPRSVIKGLSGLHLVFENPEHTFHPHEVFFINSMPEEG